MNPYNRSASRQKLSGKSVNSDDGTENPFRTDSTNRPKSTIQPTFLGAHSFMRYSSSPSSMTPTSPARSESIRVPFNGEDRVHRSKVGSILSLPPIGGESAFKSAFEDPMEDQNNGIQNFNSILLENMESFNGSDNNENEEYQYDNDPNDEKELIQRSHNQDSIEMQNFGVELQGKTDYNEVERHSGFQSSKKTKWVIVSVLMILLIVSSIISSLPVFTCNRSDGFCIPQLTIKLTDRSPAAKTALLTVREALKVLSYLAIDFGDTDNDVINFSLDSYYQNNVIDAFDVNTVYQLNFLGYCRLSTKDINYFCMRSYGFDLLSVFVRDAGVQLGELTKTNIFIMGDSFAIAYELAINGFNKLVNKEGTNNDYINWAILLQKFSKGLGFLSLSQFVFDSTLIGLLILLITVVELKLNPKAINTTIHIKKWTVFLITTLGFLNVLISFLISSLTLEYALKMKELATSVGIANVTTGYGFILIWISFILHSTELVFIILLANLYRKGLL